MKSSKTTTKRAAKKVELTPAEKAWKTIRATRTPEEITAIYQGAAQKAAATRKQNLEIAAAAAAKKTRKGRKAA